MQGDPQIIDLLNEVLTAELTAVNQYFLDAKMFDNWGYERLAERFRSESIDEMKDADHLIERLLYLEGHPNLQRLGTIRTGESPVEKLSLALVARARGHCASESRHRALRRTRRQRQQGPARRDPGRRRGPRGLAGEPTVVGRAVGPGPLPGTADPRLTQPSAESGRR